MSKHTKGPWELEFTQNGEAEIAANDWNIAGIYGCIPDGQSEANARLIAAAPELLEALECLLEWAGEQDDYLGVILGEEGDKARTAIAKAKGEA